MINIGGNKIHPKEIEEVIRNFPKTLEVKVYGKPSSIIGQIIVAEVVMQSNSNNNLRDLKKFCLESLPRWKVPTSFRIVSSIKLSSTGKINRV